MDKTSRLKKTISVALAVTTTLWLSGILMVLPAGAVMALNEGDLIRGPDGIKVYIVNKKAHGTYSGWKRHIFNPAVFALYGHLKWENIKAVDQATLDAYQTSDVYRADGDTKVYSTTADGQKRWFNMTAEEFVTMGYSWDQVFIVNSAERDYYTTGAPITYGAPSEQVVAGALNVALATDTPAATTIVADTTSAEGAQALAPVLKLTLTAGSGTAKVTSIKLKRSGISADTDVANLYLYDGDTVLADSASVSSTYFTFSGLNVSVTAGSPKTLTVKMDLTNGTTSGKTIQFGVEAATHITSDATVGGTFPINGNVMSTATTADLGRISIAHISDPGTAIDAGLTDQEVWKFSLTSSDQKIKISKIKVTAIGTIQADDLANFKLHDGTSQIGSTVASMDSDKTVTFNISPAYEIAAGQSKNISLRADIVKGTSHNFYFEVKGRHDIVAMDGNYGVYLKLNQADTYSIVAATNTTTISAGSLQITKATDSASGNVAKDALSVSLAKYTFKAVGEDIKIDNLVISTIVSSDMVNLDNGKILLNGTQIGTTKDLDSDATDDGNDTDDAADASGAGTDDDTQFSFGSSFIAKAGVSNTLEVVADIKKGDGTSFTGSETITISLATGASNAIRQQTGTSLNAPSSDTAGNQLTVAAGAISAGKNQTVANMTVITGASNVLIGSWLLTAGAAEAVDVNSIVLKDNDDGTAVFNIDNNGVETWGDAFNNLKLMHGTTQLGSVITSPTATGDAVAQTFNLSTALRVPAGQSKQIDLYADILTGATWTADFVGITSITGTGVSTNATVSFTGTASTSVAGQTITIATAGALAIANEASPTMPNTQYMVAGDTSQTVAAWKFSASNVEELKVYRLKVKQVQTDVDAPRNVKNLKLYVGSTQVGGTVPALTDPDATASVDEYAIFEDANGLFSVPKNGYTSVKLVVDITPADNAAFGTNGEQFKFRISNVATQTATTDVSAKGTTSGTYATGTTADYDSNSMIVVKTKPTFALHSSLPSTTLVPANVEIIRFSITAHAANNVVFDGTNHNIRFTVAKTGTATNTSATVTLYDADTNLSVGTATGVNMDTATTIDIANINTTIPAGQTKWYYVKADLAGLGTTGNTYQLSIANAAADLSWSDGTTSADINNANVTGYGLPLDGRALVKP